ncbi:kinase-like domain-containing protein [Globomyces pollinis-pini]|nr:kinase-like domain-containing protein [Globomyces pollinis-pini]
MNGLALSTEPDKESTLPSVELTRHCENMRIYFLDHYFDLLTYLDERKKRLSQYQLLAIAETSEVEKSKEWKRFCGKERVLLRKRRIRLRISNFQIIKQIGQGGYGQVYLVQKKDTQEICALKKMSKSLLHKLGEIKHILTERDVLTKTQSPWLVKLLYAFQDMESVYLAMEYVPGGDFRTLLNASGVIHEHFAKFYFAEMCASVFALHKLGYIHRDLKPENFLIDATGHIKLTDFGLSRGSLGPGYIEMLHKKLEMVKSNTVQIQTASQRFNTYQTTRQDVRAFSLVGSPDYMSYEVLTQANSGYDLSVDYWSLGCILFESLCGYPPFTAPTTDRVWVNLYNWEKVLARPIYEGKDSEFNLSDESWDLITKLITYVNQRYRTPQEIKQHPFLTGIDFRNLRVPGAFEIPLIPILKNELDTTYFDDFTDPKDMALYADIKNKEKKLVDGSDVEVLQSAFVGFTFKYRNPSSN